MQIAMRRRSPCSTGAGPTLWERYRQDGDGDGHAERFDFADAVATAAVILRKAKGAPPPGGSAAGYRRAACAYYGACSDAAVPYADQVMARAVVYGFHDGEPTDLHAADKLVASTGDGCALQAELPDAGVAGAVQIAAGANLPDRPLAPETLAFLARVAGIYGKPLIVTTGTNHSYYTVDGNVSDHASGHAADIGMAANAGTNDGPVGDQIMTACLIAAGIDSGQATRDAHRGGLYTLEHERLRIQCIWKTDEGGDHHGHVHMGARPSA
jgi:hypothetical protein